MKIGLVSCVKIKRNYKTKASNLYVSPLFKKAWSYSIKTYDKSYILSAKYGLVSPDVEIEPYDLTLNNFSEKDKKVWSEKVYNQIKDKIGLDNTFYFHTGENYRKYLIDKLKCKIPMNGLGLGEQLQWYNRKGVKHGLFS